MSYIATIKDRFQRVIRRREVADPISQDIGGTPYEQYPDPEALPPQFGGIKKQVEYGFSIENTGRHSGMEGDAQKRPMGQYLTIETPPMATHRALRRSDSLGRSAMRLTKPGPIQNVQAQGPVPDFAADRYMNRQSAFGASQEGERVANRTVHDPGFTMRRSSLRIPQALRARPVSFAGPTRHSRVSSLLSRSQSVKVAPKDETTSFDPDSRFSTTPSQPIDGSLMKMSSNNKKVDKSAAQIDLALSSPSVAAPPIPIRSPNRRFVTSDRPDSPTLGYYPYHGLHIPLAQDETSRPRSHRRGRHASPASSEQTIVHVGASAAPMVAASDSTLTPESAAGQIGTTAVSHGFAPHTITAPTKPLPRPVGLDAAEQSISRAPRSSASVGSMRPPPRLSERRIIPQAYRPPESTSRVASEPGRHLKSSSMPPAFRPLGGNWI